MKKQKNVLTERLIQHNVSLLSQSTDSGKAVNDKGDIKAV